MALTKDEEIIKKGYNPNPVITIPKIELLDFLTQLDQQVSSKTNLGVYKMTLKDALCDAQKFFDYYLKLHDVNFVKYHHFGPVTTIVRKVIHPYKIPIKLVPADNIFSGAVIEEITKATPAKIYFQAIQLSKQTTEQTSSSYVHEITHTQLDSLPGIINSYYNSEFLSVFLELFHASILDSSERILRLNDTRRLYEMQSSAEELIKFNQQELELSRAELLECRKYLESDLKAYNLFITFYNGSDELKNEILDDIQAIFDGYMTVEELLTKYEITYQNSQNEQRLLTYFNR